MSASNVCQKPWQDKGSAWLVVFGAFISHFLTCGMEKGFSILYVEIMQEYNSSAAATSALGGLSAAIRLILAPVAVQLCQAYTEQKVVIFGGFLSCAGLLLTAFSPHFTGVAVGYGLIFGFGLTLVFTPSLIVCTTYFVKRRATALGLSLTGCGFGSLALPYMMVYLLDKYSYTGAVVILSSFILHYCVSGALFFPPPETSPKPLKVESPGPSNALTTTHPSSSCGIRQSIQKFFVSIRDKFVCGKLLHDFWAMLFLSSFIFNMMGSGPVITLLVHYAEQHGVRKQASVLLLAVEGGTQVVVRLLTGFLFDAACVKPHRKVIWCIDLCASSLIIVLISAVSSLEALTALMFFRGLFMAVYVSQQTVIAVDMCEGHSSAMHQAIGLTQFNKGIGVFLGSWLAGLIKDRLNDYRPAFIFLGLMQFLGSVMALVAVLGSSHYRCLPSCCRGRHRNLFYEAAHTDDRLDEELNNSRVHLVPTSIPISTDSSPRVSQCQNSSVENNVTCPSGITETIHPHSPSNQYARGVNS